MSVLMLVSAYLAGMAIAMFGAAKHKVAYRIALSLPLGLTVWAWFVFAGNMLLAVPYQDGFVLLFAAAALTTYLAASSLTRAPLLDHIFVAAAIVVALLVLKYERAVFLSNDSFFLQFVGDQIAANGRMPDDVRSTLLLAYPLLLPFAYLPSLAVGILPPANIPNLPPLITMHCVAALALITWRLVGKTFSDRRAAAIFCVVMPLALLSSAHMTMQAIHFNHHVLMGFALLVLADSIRNPVEIGWRASIIPAATIAMAFMCRLEATLFVALVPFVFYSPTTLRAASFRPAWFASAILATMLFGYYAVEGSTSARQVIDGVTVSASIISNKQCLVQIAVIWGVFFAHLDFRISRIAFAYAVPVFLAACVALIVIGFWSSPPAMASGVDAVVRNMLNYHARSGWDWTWRLVWVLAIIPLLFKPRLGMTNPWLSYAFLFILAVIAINAFRLDFPYRYGWYDSAARMMAHVLPIAALGVSCLWRDFVALRSRSAGLVFRHGGWRS